MDRCKLCKKNDIAVIHKGTRDRNDIDVLKCNHCGLVFLSKIITDDTFYVDSKMHQGMDFGKWRDNTFADDNRRFSRYKDFIKDKKILDFGCGNGGFLTLVQREKLVRQGVGIDLDLQSIHQLRSEGVECYNNISELPDGMFDVVFMFHVIEHLPNPELILDQLFERIPDHGVMIIETPNADDALLSIYHCDQFADFTYWSPHIYLYNESTLTKMLTDAGFEIVESLQEQRYPLANHLRWLAKGLPGGGIAEFQDFNIPEINSVYREILRRKKACDTLIFTIRRKR